MNSFNNSPKEKKLLKILGSFDLKNLSSKEIDYFKNKRILITGVSGIIGLNLLFFFDTMVEKKKISLKIDGTFNISLFNFVKKYFSKKKFIKFKKIDLAKSKLANHESYDLIFHCAGYGQPAKFLKFSSSTYKLNSIAIMNLNKNLKKNGKFIFMSTTEIYSGNNSLCNEKSVGYTTPDHPRSAYIDSKKFGESYLINNNRNFLIYRICLTYGPGAKLNDERILNLLLLRSIKNQQIDIYGGMSQVRSNLFIDDAINLIIKSTSSQNKEIFNISNHQMTTLREMIQIISQISGKKIKKHKNTLTGSPKIIKISNKKILDVTNYKISTNLKEGLIKTYEWYSYLIK